MFTLLKPNEKKVYLDETAIFLIKGKYYSFCTRRFDLLVTLYLTVHIS